MQVKAFICDYQHRTGRRRQKEGRGEPDIPPLEQYPFRMKKLHSGIFLRLNSCRNSHDSPFLHRPFSQCLQTRLLKFELLCPVVCLSGHSEPRGQCPCRYALHAGRLGEMP